MRSRLLLLSLVVLSEFLTGLLSGSPSQTAFAASPLQAGAATSNLTPPMGSIIIGNWGPQSASYIHDDLHARCLVLKNDETELAFVICDLLGIAENVCRAAREQIAEKTGIPAGNVLIAGTHTHSAATALGEDRFNPIAPLDDYQKFIVSRITDGVRTARGNLRPAELAVTSASVPEHVFNRRWYLKEGTLPVNPFGKQDDLVQMNPGRGSVNLVRPAGPTDPVASIIAVRGTDGLPISIFTSYSLHYVGGVGEGHVSADYFGMFCESLKHQISQPDQDPPFVGLLANGTSGDINNINFKEASDPHSTKLYEKMRYVANDLAAHVLGAVKSAEYQRDITLAARYSELELGVRMPTREQLEWAEKKSIAGPQSAVDIPYIYSQRIMAITTQNETAPMPLQTFRVGDTLIGTMPCEVFCEIGLEFKERSPMKSAFMISIAQGYYGYLPPPRQLDLGGYETWLGTNRLERDASVKMLNELMRMADEIK